MNGLVVLSVHDVAPATLGEVERLRRLLEHRAGRVPVSMLVVPRYHGRRPARGERAALADACAGTEPVLHGFEHRDARGRDGAEFRGRPDPGPVAAALAAGAADLREAGLHARGFVAPAYGHSPALDAALPASGLEWWATRSRLHGAGTGQALPSVGLGASSALRRRLGPGAARLAVAVLWRARALRLDLHPADLRYRSQTAALEHLLDAVLAQGRRPVTHADLLRVAPRTGPGTGGPALE